MTITRPAYCTREDVLRATDVALTGRTRALVDQAIVAAANAVDGITHRRFFPWTGTRYFRWPDRVGASYRLWLEESELISLTSLTGGGTAISPLNVFTEPSSTGPPYDSLEVDLSSSATFGGGSTWQRDVAVTGVWGYTADTAPAGTVAEALDASETAVEVSDSSSLGVGDLLLVGTEQMLITDTGMLTTGQTLQTPLTASTADTAVAVTTGSAYAPGEVLQLDAEQMLVESVAGNTLTVVRAVNGTVLATHSGSTIYAPRLLTVVRGAVGTTAATHLISASASKHVPPALIQQYALAEACTMYANQSGGWARPAGAGARTPPDPGAGLPYLRQQVIDTFARIRIGAI